MKIRKFEGSSEQELMERVKEELGADALILNIKRVQPRGIFKLFRKPLVEISAAYDENTGKQPLKPPAAAQTEQQEAVGQSFLEQLAKRNQELKADDKEPEADSESEPVVQRSGRQNKIPERQARRNEPESADKFGNQLVQRFYDSLIEQDILPSIAEDMLSDFADFTDDDDVDMTVLAKLVYNTIIDIVGEPGIIDMKNTKERPLIAVFMGSTGVGKTTTIAKLSAGFILKDEAELALITADTYRVAAVEQLKTYSDILGIETGVVYNNEDLLVYLDMFKEKSDIILIDTAGRSHKNNKNVAELRELLELVPNSEHFLVLSLTTKYEDMLSIVETYSEIGDFKLLFTKLDETMKCGTILNICHATGKRVSYITTGQNVPDDLLVLKPEILAKAILGLGDEL